MFPLFYFPLAAGRNVRFRKCRKIEQKMPGSVCPAGRRARGGPRQMEREWDAKGGGGDCCLPRIAEKGKFSVILGVQ